MMMVDNGISIMSMSISMGVMVIMVEWVDPFLCLSVTKTTAIRCDNGDDDDDDDDDDDESDGDDDNDDDDGDGDDESWYLVAGELVAAARNV